MAKKTKILKLNYSPDTLAAVFLSEKSINLNVGTKTGLTITESGVVVNLNTPSNFQISSDSMCYAGFTRDMGFPYCFLPGPVSMPARLPNIPFGVENIMTMAQQAAICGAMAAAFSAL